MNNFLKSQLAASLIFSVFSVSAQSDQNTFAVKVNEAEKRIDITVDGKSFTSYIYPDALKKPVLYPILSPRGSFITRGWPLNPRPSERVDHPHHIGLWFNFGDLNGHDYWNNSNNISPSHKGPFGTIRHHQVNKISEGKGKAELDVSMNWYNSKNEAVLREDTKYIFSGDSSVRTIERITTLTALEDALFRDNKEGLFALRIARELEQPYEKAEILTQENGEPSSLPMLTNAGVSGKYLSSGGKEGDAVWGTRARWVALHGEIKAEKVTVAMFDHPTNPGFPSSWHARGYGLFGVNPFGKKSMGNSAEDFNYTLPKGKSVRFRHTLAIYSDTLTKEQLEKKYKELATKK